MASEFRFFAVQREMDMQIVQARHHYPAAHIDDFGLWPDEDVGIVVQTNEYQAHAMQVFQLAAIATVSA